MTPNDEKLNKLEEEAKKNAEEVLSDEDLDQAAGGKIEAQTGVTTQRNFK